MESSYELRKLNKILVANRGEIAIRVFRAATELKIQTVAVYTYEDRYSLHRYKADEAYQLGGENDTIGPYLDVEGIIQLAKRKNINAIHPGYGLLAENVLLAKRCEEEGIIFVGPRSEAMHLLGDKIGAKKVARKLKIPVIEDSVEPLTTVETALSEAHRLGYPVIFKASQGGGGRGMRVVHDDAQLKKAFVDAKAETKKAFGDDTIFLEKYIDDPKHIEIQIIGDNYGNIVHLFERDCSVQRRFQKIVEVAPCKSLKSDTKEKLYKYALEIVKFANYSNAGTVEFLVDREENIYFIEINTRIQVEHTITEEITGIDIVRTQILIAEGCSLQSPLIGIRNQSDVTCSGYAIQCRITTEDPLNDFRPDYGKLIAFRSPGGFRIRLDTGNAYTGAIISPYFDSLLVKVTASGRSLLGATQRLYRALVEFRLRGVATNITFLENVITHPVFLEGKATVRFIERHPELLQFTPRKDRATKVLKLLAETIVNGNPDVKVLDRGRTFRTAHVPTFERYSPYPKGSRDRLHELGRDGFISWLLENKQIQYTDTTFRDAHQSLLATRMRTIDMLRVAESFAKHHPEVFSMEVWGGATFDVALRFLRECPWERLRLLREAVPNILFQMLLRGSNAVGYTAYPDNLIEKFIEKAFENGVDIFRIFDSMNWLEAMKPSIRAVRENTKALAEGAICYTGDILDPERKKFNLQYYVDLARKLEDEGVHILGIKDMAGLLKPYSAKVLIEALRKHIKIPIHLHTHDTAAIQAATYLTAIEAGVDAIDVALASMSGLTSQPNFNSIVAMLKGHERELPIDLDSLNDFSNYWEAVREYYYPFESGLRAGTAEVYAHEIPGGQYSNLRPQARALGLEDKFETIKKNYVVVNRLFGDVIKVTPSSKVVGDLALFMTSNDLTENDIMERGGTLSFPESVKSFFKGELGQAHGGFPKKLQELVLRGEKPLMGRPNEHLKPIDFKREFEAFQEEFNKDLTFEDFLSFKLYPKVFKEYFDYSKKYGRAMPIPTPAFYYGLRTDEEVLVEIAEGKTLIVRLSFVSEPDENGFRTVSFKLNGQSRAIEILDKSLGSKKVQHRKASEKNEIGSPLRGKLSKVLVKEGGDVVQGAALFVLEAMKMESTVTAASAGKVKRVHLNEGTMVDQDDLIMEIEAK